MPNSRKVRDELGTRLMAIAARSTVIVLLNKKDDHRELQTVKSGLFGAKAGYDKKRMPDVTLHSVNNLMITVTPNQDLAPGEYINVESNR